MDLNGAFKNAFGRVPPPPDKAAGSHTVDIFCLHVRCSIPLTTDWLTGI